MKAKKILSAVLTLGVIATCGFVGCDKKESQTELKVVEDLSTYNGQVVRPNESYAMTSAMAFLGADLVSGQSIVYEPVSVEVSASVYPVTSNQKVNWALEFADKNSAWAKGKIVSNYMTVSAENGEKTCTLTCLAPFGEQINLICSSQENSNIKAVCTLDFVQILEDISVSFGDLEICLGGETEIVWEIAENVKGVGGDFSVELKESDVYTIPYVVSMTWDLVSPDVYYNRVEVDENWGTLAYDDLSVNDTSLDDGYFKVMTPPAYTDKTPDVIGQDLYDFVVKSYDYSDLINGIYFDADFFYNSLYLVRRFTYHNGSREVLTSMKEFAQQHFGVGEESTEAEILYLRFLYSLREGSLYTLRLTVNTAMGEVVYFDSLIKVFMFSHNPVVQSIELSETNLRF